MGYVTVLALKCNGFSVYKNFPNWRVTVTSYELIIVTSYINSGFLSAPLQFRFLSYLLDFELHISDLSPNQRYLRKI